MRHAGIRDRAHLRPRRAEMAALGDRVGAVPATPRDGGAAPPPRAAVQRRGVRGVPPPRVPRPETVLIEGLDALVPMLDEAIELGAGGGAHGVVIGMAHRGRLSALAHTLGQPYEAILREFEGERVQDAVVGNPEGGTGDVKYHLGAEGAKEMRRGRSRSRSSPTRATSRRSIPSSRVGRVRSRPIARLLGDTTRRSRSRSSSTATPPSRARASSPRRSTSRASPATPRAARSI